MPSDGSISRNPTALIRVFVWPRLVHLHCLPVSSLLFARTADWRKCAPAELGGHTLALVPITGMRTEMFSTTQVISTGVG